LIGTRERVPSDDLSHDWPTGAALVTAQSVLVQRSRRRSWLLLVLRTAPLMHGYHQRLHVEQPLPPLFDYLLAAGRSTPAASLRGPASYVHQTARPASKSQPSCQRATSKSRGSYTTASSACPTTPNRRIIDPGHGAAQCISSRLPHKTLTIPRNSVGLRRSTPHLTP
jgi:hypothetical protein